MKGMDRRPHVQGDAAAIDVELTDEVLTDGAGLTVLRALWDKLEIGAYLDRELAEVGGRYRPSLHAEQWIALLAYGGGCMDHLPLLESRGVRALPGWERVVHPTSFGRFVRRVGRACAKACDEVLRKVVQARWKAVGGVPRVVQLTLDSTVNVRYGVKQAGAEVGYNPKKHGRTSHHPLLAFLDTGDCLGVQWRPGKAHTAAGAEEWLEELVAWLREQGGRRIVVRLDKGVFRGEMLEEVKGDRGAARQGVLPGEDDREADGAGGRLRGEDDRAPDAAVLQGSVREDRRGGGGGLARRAVGSADAGRAVDEAGRGRRAAAGQRGGEIPGDDPDQPRHRPDDRVGAVQPGRAGGAADGGAGPAGGGPHGGRRPGGQPPAVEPGRARLPAAPLRAHPGGPHARAGEDDPAAGAAHAGEAGAARGAADAEADAARRDGEAPPPRAAATATDSHPAGHRDVSTGNPRSRGSGGMRREIVPQ